MSWWQRFKKGLEKTSVNIAKAFQFSKLDADALEQIEESLILSDMGLDVAVRITQALVKDKPQSAEEAQAFLQKTVVDIMTPVAKPLVITNHQPFVILFVGVNGTGKTTTIGKLAEQLKSAGKQVSMGAIDTFRMAAIEQLSEWGRRTGCAVYANKMGADPAGTAYDALVQAKKNGDDVLLLDTAGRLQNKKELMDEMQKIIRVLKKVDHTAPHATLLVLDATVGQNALSQVATFKDMADVTGLVMTKLDGTAKGGILVALAEQFKLPIHYVGVGESVDDLHDFTAEEYAKGLLGSG